jgi:hypothetical protein
MEFADLDMLKKGQMIKAVATKASTIKDHSEEITETMKQVKSDFEDMRESAEKLKNMEQLLADGKLCQKNNKKTLKACYEFTFEPIKA